MPTSILQWSLNPGYGTWCKIFPLRLLSPPTSCCPGCYIPFYTLSLSYLAPANRCKKIKKSSQGGPFSWDFHLFSPSSLPLLYVNKSWAEGSGKLCLSLFYAISNLECEEAVFIVGYFGREYDAGGLISASGQKFV